MNEIRYFGLPDPLSGMALLIRISDSGTFCGSVLDKFARQLELLHKRFAFHVLICTAAPEPLGIARVTQWLFDGLLAQVVYSGANEFLLHDLTVAAVRSQNAKIIFVDAHDLVFRFAPVVKFIVSCIGLDTPVRISKCQRMLYCTRPLLRKAGLADAGDDWPTGLQRLALRLGVVLGQGTAVATVSVMDTSPSGPSAQIPCRKCHLFLTHSGVQRLGGYESLTRKPMIIGGLHIEKFDAYWVLANGAESSLKESAREASKLAGSIPFLAYHPSPAGNRAVVFDINPATLNVADGLPAIIDKEIRVPRQVLFARVVSGLPAHPPVDGEALFIVSNYNKERYIHATLYSLVMQTYPQVSIELVDDVSDDKSISAAEDFVRLLMTSDEVIKIRTNTDNRGTYWIRNDIVNRNLEKAPVYFINDSDDYSSAQRGYLQMAANKAASGREGCFFDIVRVDQNYRLLPLNEEVERYGTASLCFQSGLIKKVGYFQNVRKNADTEFIERIRSFLGNTVLPWIRYPVLFQPFDGGNLTADIYSLNSDTGALSHISGTRATHTDAFRKHHSRIKKENLISHFTFPTASLPREYSSLKSDFLIRGYESVDECMILMPEEPDSAEAARWLDKGYRLLFLTLFSTWKILTPKQPEYSTDQDLGSTLISYRDRRGFSGYIIPASVVAPFKAPAVSPGRLLGNFLKELIYQSKRDGDRYAYTTGLDRLDPFLYLREAAENQPLSKPAIMHILAILKDQ
ncbi:MAG: glycosyltransferase family A protein [Candidatus Accumulibacter sp. UW20]|jgi:glycosyltransferase involved in cell wall biosynthesis